MKIRIVLLILAGLAFNFVTGQETTNSPQASYDDKPIIEMSLNGQTTWVLLDTGTDITILNSKVAKDFGFTTFVRKGTQLRVPGFGSNNNILKHVSKAELMFGDVELKQHFYAFDISNITESIEKRTGKKISAILGTNTMMNYGFVIDMGSKTVAMRTP